MEIQKKTKTKTNKQKKQNKKNLRIAKAIL